VPNVFGLGELRNGCGNRRKPAQQLASRGALPPAIHKNRGDLNASTFFLRIFVDPDVILAVRYRVGRNAASDITLPNMTSNGTEASFRFSTDHVPDADRDAVWREVVARQYMHLDVEPNGSAPIRAEISVHRLCSTLVTFFNTSPMRYTRTRQQACADNGDFTLAQGLRSGLLYFDQRQEVQVSANEALLLANGQTGTVDIQHDMRDMPYMTVRVDGDLMRAAVKDLDERHAHRFGADSAPLRLAGSYINAVLKSRAIDPALDRLVSRHIVDLLALGLLPTEETRERARGGAINAARFFAVRDDILSNLSRPDLSAAAIARRHGVSERSIYLLFEQHSLSLWGYITEQRLNQAVALLVDPGRADMRISDIAFAVGFGDLTTFNRAFRRRFGETPRALRARAMQKPV
jgi:AraC-like DNA-binding protein